MKIEFKVNYQKTLEAILFLLSKKDSVNLYNIMKALYAADKYHLNKYGRPVTGDVYIKKTYGVLPSVAYGFFNNDLMILSSLGLDKSPIELTDKNHHYKSTRPAETKFFSKSDIEALEHGIKEYFDLDFNAVAEKNHLEKSWKNANFDSQINIADMIESEEIKEYFNDISDTFSIVI